MNNSRDKTVALAMYKPFEKPLALAVDKSEEESVDKSVGLATD